MRRLSGVGAVVLGAAGLVFCAAAVGLGWWAAAGAAGRVTRAAGAADRCLAEADAGLARIEAQLAAVRADAGEARREAERLAAETPELPRARAAAERLLDRLVPAIDRAAALADSLRTVAAGLRAAEDVVTQVGVGVEQPSRTRAAADAIDQGAEALNVPRARVDAVKSAQAVRLTRELVTLAREVAAGSERVADGLAAARRVTAAAREWTAAWRDETVFWVRAAAAGNTAVWTWGGLGQLCLVGWGRRRIARCRPPLDPVAPRPAAPSPAPR